MMIFMIKGPPVGYYTSGAKPNWTRQNKYRDYKKLVQACAADFGFSLPLVATKDDPLVIETRAYFVNGVHPDPENVHKGIVDALFYDPDRKKKGSGDKYTGGVFHPPLYDKEEPRVIVAVRATSFDGSPMFNRGAYWNPTVSMLKI